MANHTNQEVSQRALGPDLPDSEDQLFQLNALPILDIDIVKNVFKDHWEEMLSDMISIFLETLPQEKTLIESAHFEHNWDKIDNLAHKMKGGCLYMGTKRLCIACQYLERTLKIGHHEHAEKLYEQMMQVIDQTTPVLKTWLKNYHLILRS